MQVSFQKQLSKCFLQNAKGIFYHNPTSTLLLVEEHLKYFVEVHVLTCWQSSFHLLNIVINIKFPLGPHSTYQQTP
jgi:hypothetical protein